MEKFNVGDAIWIKCTVQPGPFPDEMAVDFESVDGPISGFVQSKALKETGGQWFIQGFVKSIQGNIIEAWVEGSFFTTNGLANIKPEMTMGMAA